MRKITKPEQQTSIITIADPPVVESIILNHFLSPIPHITPFTLYLYMFRASGFGHSYLFRISVFDIRISSPTHLPIYSSTHLLTYHPLATFSSPIPHHEFPPSHCGIKSVQKALLLVDFCSKPVLFIRFLVLFGMFLPSYLA
jgi:hypothetical protein